MNKRQPKIKVSLLLATIIALGAFFLVDNNIPVQALHKEEQLLDNYDDLQELADAVKDGDEEIEDIPLESMKSSDIYDDADENTQDCIDFAAKIGDNLADKEVVHCIDDVNFFKNKYSTNSSVPTNISTTDTGTSTTDTGTDDTPASDDTTTTSTTTTGTSAATGTNGTSTADDEENNLINELVKTGKFTEDEAKEFVTKAMKNGANGASTSDSLTTSNTDTSTDDTQTTSNTDTSTDDTQTTSNTDTSTDDTPSSNNEDNDDESSNTNTNNPEEYGDLNELVDDIKNSHVDSDNISLNAFKDSAAYQEADANTQDCIDLAGKIGDNLIDYEIVRCSEDTNYFQNQISNNDNNNNAADNNNNAADDTGN